MISFLLIVGVLIISVLIISVLIILHPEIIIDNG